MKFTSEIKEHGSLSFLDITISRENKKFVISAYCKPTFNSVFPNFESFIPDMHKRRLTETLLLRSFTLRTSYDNFHAEVETLKSIFKHNNYPQNFANQYIKKFLSELFVKKTLVSSSLKGN